jgi:hypothetical protein
MFPCNTDLLHTKKKILCGESDPAEIYYAQCTEYCNCKTWKKAAVTRLCLKSLQCKMLYKSIYKIPTALVRNAKQQEMKENNKRRRAWRGGGIF